MRPLLLVSVPLILGTLAVGRHPGQSEGDWTTVATLSHAFARTENFRTGVGIRKTGFARLPGTSPLFHLERRERPTQNDFTRDDTIGLWAQGRSGEGDYGTLYFEDAARKHPAGHLLFSDEGRGTRQVQTVDERYQAGRRSGIAYHERLETAMDGSGSVEAKGLHPSEGAYTLSGSWDGSHVGSWHQRWTSRTGAWEEDAYCTGRDGKGNLHVSLQNGTRVDLAFASDGSGRGIVTGSAKGLPAQITWDSQGEGAIRWRNGSERPFEDWRL